MVAVDLIFQTALFYTVICKILLTPYFCFSLPPNTPDGVQSCQHVMYFAQRMHSLAELLAWLHRKGHKLIQGPISQYKPDKRNMPPLLPSPLHHPPMFVYSNIPPDCHQHKISNRNTSHLFTQIRGRKSALATSYLNTNIDIHDSRQLLRATEFHPLHSSLIIQ